MVDEQHLITEKEGTSSQTSIPPTDDSPHPFNQETSTAPEANYIPPPNEGSATESNEYTKESAEEDSNDDAENGLEPELSIPLSRVISRMRSGRSYVDYEHLDLPPMGRKNKPYPKYAPDINEYLVDFSGPDDPLMPLNWDLKRKAKMLCLCTYMSLLSSFGSSVYSPSTVLIEVQFHVGNVVAALGVSLFVLGFATGPIMWAPMSELYGRRPPLIVGTFGYAVFLFGVAAAKDFQTIMLCRFFAGFFAGSPLAIVAAVFTDIFRSDLRGYALTIFSAMVFAGPMLGPVVGGFVTERADLGWRWCSYIPAIMASGSLVLDILFLEETYAPVVLIRKAEEIRVKTKNWAIHAPQEDKTLDIDSLITQYFIRPVQLLVYEPVVLLVSIYIALIYGILYMFLSAYPIVFIEHYHMSLGVGMLPYLGLLIGIMIGCLVFAAYEPRVVAAAKANHGLPVPKSRLPVVIFGGIIFPIGLFWFAWTGNYPTKVHWMAPCASGVLIGCGLCTIFITLLIYLVELYITTAASVMAANTLFRSGFAAAFPLFSTAMFHNLGVDWAGTLVALLATVLAPVPIFFYIYSDRIVKKSRFIPSKELLMKIFG